MNKNLVVVKTFFNEEVRILEEKLKKVRQDVLELVVEQSKNEDDVRLMDVTGKATKAVKERAQELNALLLALQKKFPAMLATIELVCDKKLQRLGKVT